MLSLRPLKFLSFLGLSSPQNVRKYPRIWCLKILNVISNINMKFLSKKMIPGIFYEFFCENFFLGENQKNDQNSEKLYWRRFRNPVTFTWFWTSYNVAYSVFELESRATPWIPPILQIRPNWAQLAPGWLCLGTCCKGLMVSYHNPKTELSYGFPTILKWILKFWSFLGPLEVIPGSKIVLTLFFVIYSSRLTT